MTSSVSSSICKEHAAGVENVPRAITFRGLPPTAAQLTAKDVIDRTRVLPKARSRTSTAFSLVALLAMTRLVSCGECYDSTVLECDSSPEWLWARMSPYRVLSAVDIAEDYLNEGPGLNGEDVAVALASTGALERTGARTFVLTWQQGGAEWRVTVDASDVTFAHEFTSYSRSSSYTERRCGDWDP